MRTRAIGRGAMGALLVGALAAATGCAYLNDRHQDLKDVLELGVTVSDEGQFGVYCGLTHFLTLGKNALYDVQLHGLANSQWDSHAMYDDSWSALFTGEDCHVVVTGGPLPPSEDLQAHRYDCGFLGGFYGRPGPIDLALNCPFVIHLGYLGVVVNWKTVELMDFLLGWTTLDVKQDDTGSRPVVPAGRRTGAP